MNLIPPPSPCAPAKGQVEESLTQLDYTLENIRRLTDILESRLDPILRVRGPSPPLDGKPSQEYVTMAECIHSKNNILRLINCDLESILDRIEL